MSCPDEILHLVERFQLNLEAYRSGQYNETQLRREFLDPFFSALGWDVENKQGYAEAYKDVIHEDAIKVGGATKAPDYCFRIGGTRKFFVEAKKPSVNLRDEISPAYQLRRYAWSAKLPLSILTDFDEFAVYDCRAKPGRADTAATARTLYVEFKEYPERWEEISSIFSRDAVLKGSFDRYAESTKAKKGTAEVDDAFLKEIESWRDTLARTIALRNTDLTQRQLNSAVQRTIDRMIFLRICEDRGIETYGALMALLNGEHVYKRLCELFHRADEKYNSGLFHFRLERDRLEKPDELTLSLSIDDKPLKEIIRNLYYPDSPYEFSVLPADILGQVYEQFLGKVIRLTAGHRAVIEDKPEVKKAGGVYYTPTYIVDYIVKNTVGKLLTPSVLRTSPPYQGGDREGVEKRALTPKQASKLRILDPACGSGSFLIGAYQYLLDWHRDWYVKDGAKKWATGRSPVLYQVSGGDWRLTTTERKRILLNNIYGVDIDPQAVEVTKLSLLLKVLEGENEQTISRQLKMFHERALPDLGSNIKCGNSLIGPDFYEGKQLSLLDEEERLRINVFDWNKEFPEIFPPSPQGGGRGEVITKDESGPSIRSGQGFDAVIGNPPYGIPFQKSELEYLLRVFPDCRKQPDSYMFFMVRSFTLLRKDGLLSLIVPNTFCDLESCDQFRKWLLVNTKLRELWQSGWAFKSAVVDTLVFLLENERISGNVWVTVSLDERIYRRELQEFLSNELIKIDYRNSQSDRLLLTKATQGRKRLVGDLATVKAGVKMYEKGKGTPPQTDKIMQDRPFSIRGKAPKGWRPLYRGEDVGRYSLLPPTEYVNYGKWLAAPRSPELFLSPKLLMRRTDDRILACAEMDDAVCVNSCHVIKLDKSPSEISHYYLLGILNSKLMQRVFELQNPQMVGKVFSEIKVVYVERLPIMLTDRSDPADKARYDRMVEMVEEMLTLHKQLASAKTEHEKTALQRQIDATDRQIDELVYELYGLTEEEIRIVEGVKNA
jgi:type I restriction-modification system DNA methylase subunit